MGIMGYFLTLAAMGFFLGGGLLFHRYRESLCSLWREPVLRYPVLIFESDDWGPGPQEHGEALQRLIRLLSAYQDSQGRHPLVTLGIILAVPDTEKYRAHPGVYRRITLADRAFFGLRNLMQEGAEAGVFALQLHGMEHYWPPALIKAAQAQSKVEGWLMQDRIPCAESLPAHLQSRWIDGATLPAKPVAPDDILAAAIDEVDCFGEIFGIKPQVAVPPTFCWNETVERGWYQAGIRFVVTPGQRYESRDERGRLVVAGGRLHNGRRSASGIVYAVRDDYFEPSFGHTADRALAALESKMALRRPCLLEMHRFNFVSDSEDQDRALAELESLLERALEEYPEIRFLSTESLMQALLAGEPALVDSRLAVRFSFWLRRLWLLPGMRRWLYLTGWIMPFSLLWRITKKYG